MKKKSFFGKLWGGIKGFFAKLLGKDGTLDKAVHIGIQVAELMKKMVDNPITPLLTALIPGGIDDAICLQLKTYLPRVLTELQIADVALQAPDGIVQYAITKLRMLGADARHKAYLDIAAMVSHFLSKDSDGGATLTYTELKQLVQYIYDTEYSTPLTTAP